MKRILPLVMALAFTAQNTGAADLAAAFGAARPGHLAFPHHLSRGEAPRPQIPTKPAGPSLSARVTTALRSYSDDLYTVVDWALERTQTPDPAPREETRAAPAPIEETADAATTAVFEKPTDRILIVKDDDIIGAANILGSRFNPSLELGNLKPTHPRVEGLWFNGKGFRFRVNYLDAYGTTFGEPNGFRLESIYTRSSFVAIAGVMPEALRRLAPIYFHGMKARFEIEIIAGDEPVRGARVFSRQEELDGRKLTGIEQLGETLNLAPGERVVLVSSAHLRGQGQARVNFERTHVVVSGTDGEVLADEPSAGLIDPPGN